MSKSLPDFVSDDEPVMPAAEATPETPAAEAPAPATEAAPAADGPARGPDGKFAPKSPAEPAPAPAEAAPAPAAEAPPAPQPAPTPAAAEPPPVPLATFLDLRDRAAAAEKRAKELEEWRAQQEAKARQVPAPSFTENPDAAAAFQAEQLQGAMFEMRRDFSRRLAESVHGKEIVDKAFEWGAQQCDNDPHFNAKVRANPDPFGFVIEQWQRDQIAAKVDPKKLEAFLAWEAAQAAAQAAPAAQPSAQPAPAVAPPPAPAAPRPSLAAAPSAATSGAPLVRDGAGTFSALFGV